MKEDQMVKQAQFTNKKILFEKNVDFPELPGVYKFFNSEHEIIYIGSSKNIKKQISDHLISNKKESKVVRKDVSKVTYSIKGGKLFTILKEQNDIKKKKQHINKSKN